MFMSTVLCFIRDFRSDISSNEQGSSDNLRSHLLRKGEENKRPVPAITHQRRAQCSSTEKYKCDVLFDRGTLPSLYGVLVTRIVQ